jgi:hypothetical protein
MIDAAKQASPDIDRQFQGAPDVAARLHHAIATAFDNRSAFAEARKEYDRAAALFVQADGGLSQEAVAVRLQRAAMEARTYQKDALAQAKSIVQEEQKRLAGIPKPRADVAVWLAAAQGMIALIENDAKASARYFQAAYSGSERLPGFDENTRLNLKQKLAFTNIRLGDGATAERLFRELIAEFARTSGPDSPRVLRIRLNLAQAYMIQNKNREAIDEVNAIYPQYLARLGADHELTMQLLTTRAQCEGRSAFGTMPCATISPSTIWPYTNKGRLRFMRLRRSRTRRWRSAAAGIGRKETPMRARHTRLRPKASAPARA